MCKEPHLCHSEAGKMIFTYLCANNVLVGVYVIQCVIVILLNGAQRLLPAPCDTFQRSLWLEEGEAKERHSVYWRHNVSGQTGDWI